MSGLAGISAVITIAIRLLSMEWSDQNLPLAGTVELAEEDPLPGAERELATVERDEHLRAHQGRAHMRGCVFLTRLDVLPAPVVPHHSLERDLEVARDGRIGMLLDGDAGGRVRDVDQNRGCAVLTVERLLDLRGDVDQLRPPVAPKLDLAHRPIS